jgi:hypothetical protein
MREWEKKASTTTTTITTKKTKKENNNLWKERVFFSEGKPRAKDTEIHIENAALLFLFKVWDGKYLHLVTAHKGYLLPFGSQAFVFSSVI